MAKRTRTQPWGKRRTTRLGPSRCELLIRRSSSGSQSRPLRPGGAGGGPRSGAGQSSSARSSQAKGAGGAPREPSRPDIPCTRGRRAGPRRHSGKSSQAGKGAQRGQVGKNRRPSQGTQGPSPARSRQAAPGTARSARTSSTQAARSDRRRNSWGKGIQWAHIGGGRLTGAPTRSRKARTSPAADACASRSRLSPVTVCAVPWCWAESSCSSSSSS